MPTMSFPYNPSAILKADIADDNSYKQIFNFIAQSTTQSGWAEVLDAGYAQLWAQSMAFSTVDNAGTPLNAGGTSTAVPASYPNLAMDNNTGNNWQSNGQPTLAAAHYAVGYDAGVGNTVAPVYHNLWLQGANATTDPTHWVMEYSDTMDTNYDWASATWTVIQSSLGINTTAGNLSVCSVSLTPGGTGWIENTKVTSVTSSAGKGAIIQPIVTPGGGAITGFLIANPGVGYVVGDALVFAVASAGSGATATVGSVNGAGQILTVTLGAGGSAYVCNPVAAGTGGTGTSTYAVFTTTAIGVSGAIAQVLPCINAGGYAFATPPTVTITQPTGGSSPASAPTCTAKLSMTTGGAAQLNRFDIPCQFWAAIGTPAGPAHRAFRLRILQNVSSVTSVNIFEWQLINAAGTYVNNGPSRMAPTSAQTNTKSAWKIFQMQDALQSTCPVYMRIDLGSGATWQFPSIWITLGSGTDGSGNLVGQQTTSVMQLTSAAGSSTVQPAWFCGNTNWLHFTLFKGTSGELLVHVERNQVAGVDDATVGATVLGASSALASMMTMPQTGAAPGMETSWGAQLGTNPGSVDAAVVQLEYIRPRKRGWLNPLKKIAVYETNSGIADGATQTVVDAYGNSVVMYADGNNCTHVANGLTTGRVMVKNSI